MKIILTIVLITMLAGSTLARPQGLRLGVDDRQQERVEDQGVTSIVGGEDVPSGVFPFFAQFTLGCGGSLIASDMLITVAHVS
jgi:hypothetical protein